MANNFIMPNPIDHTGKQQGKLTVLHKSKNRTGYGYIKWVCQCDCGNIKEISGAQLQKGTKSCGCLSKEINSKRSKGNEYYKFWKDTSKAHGLSYHPLRAIRKAMIHRCYNHNNKHYATYGGRGIIVCDEWLDSLVSFVEWAENNGWKKGLSLDRIDNDKDYNPENCQWITRSENSRKNCVLGKLVGKGRKKRDNPTTQI